MGTAMDEAMREQHQFMRLQEVARGAVAGRGIELEMVEIMKDPATRSRIAVFRARLPYSDYDPGPTAPTVAQAVAQSAYRVQVELARPQRRAALVAARARRLGYRQRPAGGR